MDAKEALAEVWASMDGNAVEFSRGRTGPDDDGYYEGYLSDASEMQMRLHARGFQIVPLVARVRD